ncbi:MAG: hypothetical protein ACIARR_05815 [Phycisphaerales bacterium JB059]
MQTVPDRAERASVRDLCERAWAAHHIYGDDHAAFLSSARQLCDALPSLEAPERLARVDTGDDATPDPDSFSGTLLARDIGAIQLGDRLEVAELASVFRALRHATCSGTALAERVAGLANAEFRLLPLDFDRLSRCVTDAPPPRAQAGGAPFRVDQLGSILLNATTPDARDRAASWIRQAIGEGHLPERTVAAQIRDAVRSSCRGDAESNDGVEHIRSVLASLSPELRQGLIQDECGPDLEAITELSGVLPVLETCEALASSKISEENVCHSTLMMFQRLATLAQGQSAEIACVGDLASQLAGKAPNAREARALEAIGELCKASRREEFTPREYLERLHEISANQIEPVAAPPDLDWESPDEESAHAAAIVLHLMDEGVGDASLREGHLRFLLDSTEAMARVGRLDLVARVLAACVPLAHDPDPKVRGLAERLAGVAGADQTLALAASRAGSGEQLASALSTIESLDDPFRVSRARVLVRAYALDPHGAASAWIAPMLSSGGAELSEEIEGLLAKRPGMVESLLSLINDMEASAAFEALRPALLLQDDVEARRRAFAAVYSLRHEWPRDLCHLALVDEDDKVRTLGLAYILRRSSSDHFDLLVARLFDRLGGTRVTRADRACIVEQLGRAGTPRADRALTSALLGACWRPAGGAHGLGRSLSRAVRRRPGGTRSLVARILWSLSPNRAISAIRPGQEGATCPLN